MLSQATMSPASNVTCNSNYSIVFINISSGVAPYSFTVQTPCSTTFTSSSSSTTPSFTLNCPGNYTFTIKDSNNNLLGTLNHTVVIDSSIGISIFAPKDSICTGQSLLLAFTDSGPSYTISPINWNTGATTFSIMITPTASASYSFSGLYTSSSSKTCTATGTKSIVVSPCSGIIEYNLNNSIKLFPNPISNILYIESEQYFEAGTVIEITNTLGQAVLKLSFNKEIDLTNLSSGYYTLKITCPNSPQIISKFIKD
jgi:hypothetical protein